MFRIHDVMTCYQGLNLSGLAFYADRSLVLPGIAVIKDGPDGGYLDYLASVGIGASRVLRVRDDSLVRAAFEDEAVRQALIEHAGKNGKVQFFATSRHEERLLGLLGLGWPDAFSAPCHLTPYVNSKAHLRRLGGELGFSAAFPEHVICDSREELYPATAAILRGRCDFAVLKRPDLASGDGMVKIPRGACFDSFIEDYWAKHRGHEIIVEAGHDHLPLSVQWELADGGPEFVCAAGQLIDPPFEHKGNVISSDPPPSITSGDVAEMRRLSAPFVDHYWALGYRGVCGFDFLKTAADGRMLMLECNGRVTASTYAVGVARQVAPRLGSWAVCMSNVSPSASVRTIGDVAARLGSLLFDGVSGALPFNIRCLTLPRPKLALCCVDREVVLARRILDAAQAALS